jgi:DNA polymerase-3 subunit gamma/tau
MTEQLTTKYRPSTFKDMVGQKVNAVVLSQMVKTEQVPEALLFRGPRGVGKTSAARILAMELNPTERDAILAGTSLSVLEIDAASHGSVADIRALIDQLSYRFGGDSRVVILDEAHMITREGFNTLLKTLEEPPANVVFVFVTTEAHKLPETVLDRLTEFEFRRVSPADVYARVIHVAQAEDITIEDALAVKLAEDSNGSVRNAIKNLDFAHRSGITKLDEYTEHTGEKDIGPLLFAALLTGDHAKIFAVYDRIMMETGDPRVIGDALSNFITDLFIIKADGEVKAAGKALEYRKTLAKKVSGEALLGAVQVLWDLKTKIRWSEDQRTALASALTLVSSKMAQLRASSEVTPDTPAPSRVVSDVEAPRVLSISEIQQS